MKKQFLLFVFFAVSIIANAQYVSKQNRIYKTYKGNTEVQNDTKKTRLGIVLGINLNEMSKSLYDSKVGFRIGLKLDNNLDNVLKGLYWDASLLYSVKSGELETDYFDSTLDANYLELPINIGYRGKIANKLSGFISMGPYFAYGVGGSTETVYGSSNKKDKCDTFGSGEEDGGMKEFDAGLGFNLGLEYSSFQFSLGYQLGLAKLYEESSSKNKNLIFTLSYLF